MHQYLKAYAGVGVQFMTFPEVGGRAGGDSNHHHPFGLNYFSFMGNF